MRNAIAVALLFFVTDRPGTAGDCPWWRPCGPGNPLGGNRLVPQSAFGFDVRPACARHDECYRTATGTRIECDRAYLSELRTGCQDSRHPWLCNRVATLSFLSIRTAGKPWYGKP